MKISSNSINSKECRIAIFFGGKTNEKNISLDSARTFYDSLHHDLVEENIHLIYVDEKFELYEIEKKWIYSNTIDDFNSSFLKNKPEKIAPSSPKFRFLLDECHAFFPFIHGKFGEDGKLQSLIEKQGRQAILGSPRKTLRNTINKHLAYKLLEKNGFHAPKHLKFSKKDWTNQDSKKIILNNELAKKDKIIVKPADGGSSDGVTLASLKTLESDVAYAFNFSNLVIIEEYIKGHEFSIIILEDDNGEPFPLVPTQIKFNDDKQKIYTRNKKYLPGSGAYHITPPDFKVNVIKKIIDQAVAIYKIFDFKNWVRLDGFFSPGKKEKIFWHDINGIPGFGQDSFIFHQSSFFGMKTRDVSYYLLNKTLAKENLLIKDKSHSAKNKKVIGVIGGGETSEKQISRMSWLNVIEKLNHTNRYDIKYFFLDKKKKLWQVSRFITLQHTIEEIEGIINNLSLFQKRIASLNAEGVFKETLKNDVIHARKISYTDLKKLDFLFIALHGGMGENGELQAKLRKMNIPFNGSDAQVSEICSDKKKTNTFLSGLNIKGFRAPEQIDFSSNEIKKYLLKKKITIPKSLKKNELEKSDFYLGIKDFFQSKIKLYTANKTWVLKPRFDGCSTGVLVLKDLYPQLAWYFFFFLNEAKELPVSFLSNEKKLDLRKSLNILLPEINSNNYFLLEEFISGKNLIELTVGVLEKSKNNLISLLPSKTLAENTVLSLEEKFSKGHGVNLTPPQELSNEQVDLIRKKIADFSKKLGIRGYARIDVFFNFEKDELILIEVNNLPGLTAATIIFSQAMLTEQVNLEPAKFLEHLIKVGMKRL